MRKTPRFYVRANTWWPALVAAARAALQEEALRGLAAMEQQIAAPAMRWLQKGKPFAAAYAALGVLPPDARVEAFYAAVERLVLPRLARLGIDAARSWRDRYAASTG